MYKKVGIAGKFRLVHQAHLELLIRSSFISKHVCIFIVDLPEYKRYVSIKKLISYFEFLANKLNIKVTIHVIRKKLNGILWDRKILSLQPDIDLMIDSKEVYGNTLIENLFLKLTCSEKISVSKIGENIYKRENYVFIERNFRKYLQYKIIINYLSDNFEDIKKIINILKVYYDINNSYDRFRIILKKQDKFSFINTNITKNNKSKIIDFFIIKDFNYYNDTFYKSSNNIILLDDNLVSNLISKINSYFKIYC